MKDPEENFRKLSEKVGKPNIFIELRDFLMQNKKWWMVPILLVILLFGLLIVLGGTGAAPFIYTLF